MDELNNTTGANETMADVMNRLQNDVQSLRKQADEQERKHAEQVGSPGRPGLVYRQINPCQRLAFRLVRSV